MSPAPNATGIPIPEAASIIAVSESTGYRLSGDEVQRRFGPRRGAANPGFEIRYKDALDCLIGEISSIE
jgi:hypothetical protein